MVFGESEVKQPNSGFLPLLEIRENWKALFQSGKSQGIWQFLKESGNYDHPILFCILYLFHVYYDFAHQNVLLKQLGLYNKDAFILKYRMMFSHA